jgi:hypothetical protein
LADRDNVHDPEETKARMDLTLPTGLVDNMERMEQTGFSSSGKHNDHHDGADHARSRQLGHCRTIWSK